MRAATVSVLLAAVAVAGFLFLSFFPPGGRAPWYAVLGLAAAALLSGVPAGGGRQPAARTVGRLAGLAGAGVALLIALQLTGAGPLGGTGSRAAVPGDLAPIPIQVPPAWRGEFPGGTLYGPRGLAVSVFAAGLKGPRLMAWQDGVLYVSTPAEGAIYRLADTDGDGAADYTRRPPVFATGLARPHGLAWHRGSLYVAENSRILRLTDSDGDGRADRREVVSEDLPPGGGHWTRTIGFSPGGQLFASAGSSCNVCREDDPRRAALLLIGPDGRARVWARGLRNTVDFAWHPVSGDLWGTDNGRDFLGDNAPPDELNRLVEGADYGWPFCYGDRQVDPFGGDPARCARTVAPAVRFPAHSAPLGLGFGHGLAFPAPYPQGLFVALHGSWNRSVPIGYKVVFVPFARGRPAGEPADFLTGWLQGRVAFGRPVDVAPGPDGALYVSDDRAGVVYRAWFPEASSGRAVGGRGGGGGPGSLR